ncbi:MAG: hypothetical protein HOP19_13480, partial [Acidobacteria bacterium]|nr:hypothetical protein [Acidobacteriota bacterium]
SATCNFNKWFGLKADFSGHYDSYNFPTIGKVNLSSHLFLAGGQFTYRGSDRIQPFAHLMAGTVLLRGTTSNIPCPATVPACVNKITVSDTGFAMAAGGGVDLKVAKALAIRLIQADYIYIRNDGENGHAMRLSTGVVVRLGDQ